MNKHFGKVKKGEMVFDLIHTVPKTASVETPEY